MNIPPFAIALVAAIIVVQIAIHLKRGNNKEMEKYMREEAEAAAAPDRPVPESAYYTPDTSELPLDKSYDNIDAKKAEKIQTLQSSVRKKAGLKMLRFPERLGNTELKKRYGMGNLPRINTCEEHFSGYAFAVISLGRLLLETGHTEDAEICFRHCVSMPCEQAEAYISLAGIYGAAGRQNELRELRDITDKADPPAKAKALAAIDILLNTTEVMK